MFFNGSTTRWRSAIARPQLRCNRLLWFVYALFFAAGVAQAAIVPLLPRLAALYGLSPSETGLLLALPGLATLAVSMPAGLAADRFGARRVTLASGALLCLACLAQAAPSLLALLLGRIAFGVAFGTVWTTGMAWLSEIDQSRTGARLGPSVTCSSVGVMVGPAVGGLLAQPAGVGAPFLLIAGVAALVVTPLWIGSSAASRPAAGVHPEGDTHAETDRPDPAAIHPQPGRAHPGASHGSAGSLARLARLARRPGVGAAAGGLIVSGAVSGTAQLLITSGLHGDGLSSGKIGLAFSAAAVAYILISLVTVRLGGRASTPRVNAIATLLLSLALTPALAGDGPATLVLALLLTALPRAAISTIAYSLAAQPGDRGGGGDGFVFGMLNGAWAGAMVLTPLLAGLLEQSHGADAAYLAVIVPSCLIAAGLMARSSPRRRPAHRLAAG